MSKKIGFYKPKHAAKTSFRDEWLPRPRQTRNSASNMGGIVKVGTAVAGVAMLASMLIKGSKNK